MYIHATLTFPPVHQGPYRARIEQKLRQRALAHAKDALLLRCHPPMKRVQVHTTQDFGFRLYNFAPHREYVPKV